MQSLLLLALCIGLPSVHWSVHAAPVNGATTCTTPYCREVASAILQDLHTTADPCVDFSQFACGGYYTREKLKDGEQKNSYLTKIASQNEATMLSFLMPNKQNDQQLTQGDPAAARILEKLQSFYSACTNEDLLLQIGRAPLQAELAKMTSILFSNATSAPTTIDQATKKQVLSKLLGYNMRHGLENPFTFELWDNPNIPGYRIMALQQAGLGLEVDTFYKDAEFVNLYTRIVGKMLHMIEGQEGTLVDEHWMELAENVVEFEKILAGVEAPTETTEEAKDTKVEVPKSSKSARAYSKKLLRRQLEEDGEDEGEEGDGENEETPDDGKIEWDTVDDLNEVTPSLDWHLIFQTAFPSDTTTPTELNMLWSFYLRRMDKAFSQSSMQTIRNYFAWTMIRTLGKNLADPYRRSLVALDNFLPSKNKRAQHTDDRAKYCVDMVNEHVGYLAGHFFVKSIFPSQSQQQLKDMVDAIFWTFEKSLWTYDWLDGTTRTNAFTKLKASLRKIGFSTENPNVGSSLSIEQYYQALEVMASDHFGNQVRSRQFRAERFLRDVSAPVNRNTLAVIPQTVNAYYNPTGNAIEILAGILREPFFHPDAPEYLNFAGIGSIVGHELGHEFDNSGRRYDETGQIREWWTEKSIEAFDAKTQCFIEQYGNFTINGPDGKEHNVNGWSTLGENIADNGGLKMAYDAWQHRYRTPSAHNSYHNGKLPGLENFSLEQVFFIQYARAFCSNIVPEEQVKMLNDDNHSPGKYRINGVVQNSAQFAQAFKCRSGSPMNPVNKCVLW